jgi:hypothetical protein
VLKSEEFFTHPAGVYQRVLKFLGLPEWDLGRYKQHNLGSYTALDPGLRQRLEAYFQPCNARLYNLLGVDFGWDAAAETKEAQMQGLEG